LYGGFYVKGKI